MRVPFSCVAIVAVLAAPAFALAAQTTTGIVKSYSPKAMTLTLADGVTYQLPKNFKNPGLKAGEKVNVAYEMMGKKHEATMVKILK
ncbi:DUF1344 domain-containing protein [Sinorhizobium sp. BG8]|uniref:DUF1344 domain-containing protein n=1 Tax=Sinorhizobium sp. BG8 TaxID=2613773 RepID=UPI00193E067F|nr:DUF1344 domain-containing protein [Sinorhizobium sp. BG8]QRM54631.1 DUF1344 domain-containing protein [Sinorhizobium sp. BG8]